MAMRAGIARYVVTQLELGKSVHEAVENAVKDLAALTEGLIGGVTIHAVDRDGNARVIAVNVPDVVQYWYWCEKMARPQCRRAEHIGISPLGQSGFMVNAEGNHDRRHLSAKHCCCRDTRSRTPCKLAWNVVPVAAVSL